MSRRRPSVRVLGALLFGGLVVLNSSPAAADEASDNETKLAALKKTGVAASKAKNWQACIDAYRSAASLQADPITFGELGLCEEAAGRFDAAHPHLKRGVAGIAPGSDPRRTKYQEALSRVAQHVALVFLTVTPSDARVVVDGRPVGRGDGVHVAVKPGVHVFSAKHDGYEPQSRKVAVNAREMPNVDLLLVPKPRPDEARSEDVKPEVKANTSPASPLPSATTQPSTAPDIGPRLCLPEKSARGVLVPIACVSTAAFLVSSATTIGIEVHSTSLRNSLVAQGFKQDTCTPGQPSAESPECTEMHSRALQRKTATDVLIGTGVAAGVTAIAAGLAIALAPSGPAPRVSATVSANGGGVTISGTW